MINLGPYETDGDARRDAKTLVAQYGVPAGQEDWRWAKEALMAVTIHRCGIEFGAFDLAAMEYLATVGTVEQCQTIVGWIARASGQNTLAPAAGDITMGELVSRCDQCGHTFYTCNVNGCAGQRGLGWRGWPVAGPAPAGLHTAPSPAELHAALDAKLDKLAAAEGGKDLPPLPRTEEDPDPWVGASLVCGCPNEAECTHATHTPLSANPVVSRETTENIEP